MTTEYVQRLNFFLAGVIRLGVILSTAIAVVFFARAFGSDVLRSLFNYDIIQTEAIKAHPASVILTLVFTVTFAYSLIGAVICGASDKKVQSVCFGCLFSTALGLSVVGFGLSWITPLTLAVWWMVATVSVLIGTSYFARKENTWQISLKEPQRTGKTS